MPPPPPQAALRAGHAIPVLLCRDGGLVAGLVGNVRPNGILVRYPDADGRSAERWFHPPARTAAPLNPVLWHDQLRSTIRPY